MNNPIFETAKPGVKLIFTLFIIFSSLLIFIILGILISIPIFGIEFSRLQSFLNPGVASNIPFLKYFQAVQSIAMFVIPPFVIAFISSQSVKKYLFINQKLEFISIILLFLLMISSIPIINFYAVLNSKMQLPGFLSYLEKGMKDSEENARIITETFLLVKTPMGLAVNILIIAIIPALGEELLFRGILQRQFTELTKNPHIGILIGAIIFSAIHFQFYGFLPRMLMGILFGYLLFWSKNLWFPIVAHFINNAFAVTAFYFFHGSDLERQAETVGSEPSQISLLLISCLVFIGILLYIKKRKQTLSIFI